MDDSASNNKWRGRRGCLSAPLVSSLLVSRTHTQKKNQQKNVQDPVTITTKMKIQGLFIGIKVDTKDNLSPLLPKDPTKQAHQSRNSRSGFYLSLLFRRNAVKRNIATAVCTLDVLISRHFQCT